MSWIRGVPVIPDFILIVRVEDRLGGFAECSGSRPDERFDERFEGSDDEDGDGVTDFLDQSGQTWYPIDGILIFTR